MHYAIRSGIEVQDVAAISTVELDIIVVPTPVAPAVPPIAGHTVVAAFECKAHSRGLHLSHVNEIVGKALRVWGPLPLPTLGAVSKYTLAHLSQVSPEGALVLAHHQIGHLEVPAGLPPQLAGIIGAL